MPSPLARESARVRLPGDRRHWAAGWAHRTRGSRCRLLGTGPWHRQVAVGWAHCWRGTAEGRGDGQRPSSAYSPGVWRPKRRPHTATSMRPKVCYGHRGKVPTPGFASSRQMMAARMVREFSAIAESFRTRKAACQHRGGPSAQRPKCTGLTRRHCVAVGPAGRQPRSGPRYGGLFCRDGDVVRGSRDEQTLRIGTVATDGARRGVAARALWQVDVVSGTGRGPVAQASCASRSRRRWGAGTAMRSPMAPGSDAVRRNLTRPRGQDMALSRTRWTLFGWACSAEVVRGFDDACAKVATSTRLPRCGRAERGWSRTPCQRHGPSIW